MRSAGIVLAALLVARPCRAVSWPWGKAARQVEEAEGHLLAGRYSDVGTSLRPEVLEKLRGRHLERAYLYLGYSHEQGRALDRALSVYRLGVALFPRNTDLLIRLADLLHDAQLTEEALPLYERALKVDPRNAPALLGLARISRRLGLLDPAADHFEKALEFIKFDAEPWAEYAEVLADQGAVATAELAVLRSLSIEESAAGRRILAFIRRSQGRYDEALLELARAAPRHSTPTPQGVDLLGGLWLLEAGRPAQAAESAARVLEILPDDSLARFIRARARLASGRVDLALDDLEVAAAGTEPFVARAAAELLKLLEAAP